MARNNNTWHGMDKDMIQTTFVRSSLQKKILPKRAVYLMSMVLRSQILIRADGSVSVTEQG